MKRIKKLFFLGLLLGTGLIFYNQAYAADPPPPPPDGGTQGGHNLGGNQGKGAPIDGGLGILLVLGSAYGGYKLYKSRKKI